ncbi:MAG: T9SS type A sorting domain-containing protein [Flavobacteriales bacterium]|nr:T9SS type A sorting domain-containing protein [Flavobacteriales bacterium]
MKTRLLLSSLAVAAVLAPACAQIPNGSFENWTTPTGATYEDPVGWITFNGLAALFPGMGLSCEKGTPGAVGSYYATVTTRESTGIGVLQGIVTLGDITTGRTGFAYTSRPATFTGQWQYNIQPNDSGMVAVILTKWNAVTQEGEVVGGAVAPALGSIAGWQPINVPFEYESSTTPDSAFVVVAASMNAPVTGSFIKVDGLAMSGISTGIAEQEAALLQVFPSPATDRLNLRSGTAMNWASIIDITGRPVLYKAVEGTGIDLNVSGLKPGRYMVQVELAGGKRMVRSFVKE